MVYMKESSPTKRSPLSKITKKIRDDLEGVFTSLHRKLFSFYDPMEKIETSVPSRLLSMPPEVLFTIFECASANDLCSLLSTNTTMHSYVVAYVQSVQFATRFVNAINAEESSLVPRHFASIGHLFKVCCIFKSNEDTIEQVIRFYTRTRNNLTTTYGWESMFTEVFKDDDRQKFFYFMKHFVQIDLVRMSNDVLTSDVRQGAEELKLRKLIYDCFLGTIPIQSTNFRFRLAALLSLLSPYEMEHRLIMILGAPIATDENGVEIGIDYLSAVTVAITGEAMVKQVLGDMPEIMEQILMSNQLLIPELRWHEIHVFNLLETLTTYPEPWVLPNFAAFLLASPRLARLAIFTRAIYGTLVEAGHTLFSCVEMAVRIGRDPNMLLYLAVLEVSTRCSAEVCLTMFRESIYNANLRYVELSTPENPPSREAVAEALAVTRQTISLFESMLYIIFN